jgi:hypothetical protein
MANTTRDHGTDEDGLRAAAAEFDLRIRQETLQLPEDAAKRIREVLEEGKPILLCVDHYEHWLTALPRSRGVSLTNRHVWVADPARDGDKVVQRYTWRRLLRRLQWGLADESRFDLYIVEPV